jgi:hypothetical protein
MLQEVGAGNAYGLGRYATVDALVLYGSSQARNFSVLFSSKATGYTFRKVSIGISHDSTALRCNSGSSLAR